MWGPIAWSPVRRESISRLAPGVIIGLAAVLIGLTAVTGLLVARHLQQDALSISRLYSGVFAGLNDPTPGAEAGALLQLGERVRQQGLPLVVTDGMGQVTAYANLPFNASLDDPRVKDYAKQLDRVNPPLVEPGLGTVHFGPLPARRQLGLLALLQSLTVAVMLGVAYFAYRHALASQRDRLWVAMAREAAHQMGTPLMSLQGWIEVVRSRPTPPTDLAEHLSADAERLERVAQRFERIGNPARREPIGLGALADRVAGYFRPRLPRHANPIELRVEAAGAGPMVFGRPDPPRMGPRVPREERHRRAQGTLRFHRAPGRERTRARRAPHYRRRSGNRGQHPAHAVPAGHHDQDRRMGHRAGARLAGGAGGARRRPRAGAVRHRGVLPALAPAPARSGAVVTAPGLARSIPPNGKRSST